MLIDRLIALKVDIRTQTRAIRFAEGCLTAERGGVEWTLSNPDKVVMAEGYVPRNELARLLQDEKNFRLEIIGDAQQPRTAAEAIREGFEVAYSL